MTTTPNLTNRLTEKQAIRLQNLIASGPFDRKEPVDSELLAAGWAQLYDGTDAVEAHDNAAASLYDRFGCIKDNLLPESWLRQKKVAL